MTENFQKKWSKIFRPGGRPPSPPPLPPTSPGLAAQPPDVPTPNAKCRSPRGKILLKNIENRLLKNGNRPFSASMHPCVYCNHSKHTSSTTLCLSAWLKEAKARPVGSLSPSCRKRSNFSTKTIDFDAKWRKMMKNARTQRKTLVFSEKSEKRWKIIENEQRKP